MVKTNREEQSLPSKLRGLADHLEDEKGIPLRRLSDALEDEAGRLWGEVRQKQNSSYHPSNQDMHDSNVNSAITFHNGFISAISLVYNFFPELRGYRSAKKLLR